MAQDFKLIARIHIVLLRKTRLSISDIPDVLSSIMLWKYISRKHDDFSPKLSIPDSAYFFDNIYSKSGDNLQRQVWDALNQWEENNPNQLQNLLLIQKPVFDSISGEILKEILEPISETGFRYSRYELKTYFDAIESATLKISVQAHLYSTPAEIAGLLTRIVQPVHEEKSSKSLYDPFSRSGEILTSGIENIKNIVSVSGNTESYISWKLSAIKSILLEFPNAQIKQASIYGSPFSGKFDYIITNPPFGGKFPGYAGNGGTTWAGLFGGIKTELDYLCYTLDHLSAKGQASLVVPLGILFGAGNVMEFRRSLIEQNLVEGIILLPPGVFYLTGVKTAILLISKVKNSKQTLIVNAANLGIRQRERHILPEDDIAYIADIFKLFKTKKKLEAADNYVVVSPEQFELGNFDFQFNTYHVDETGGTDEELKPASQIWEEITLLNDKLKDIHNQIEKFVSQS